MFQNILIICIGNICRSPMAEAILSARLATMPDVRVTSAGIAAMVNASPEPMAQELMQERGFDISAHRARQVTRPLLSAADLILTMETRHQKQIEYNLPSICGKVHRLGKWSVFDIPDPYKKPKAAFVQALMLIEQGIDDWQRKLWN